MKNDEPFEYNTFLIKTHIANPIPLENPPGFIPWVPRIYRLRLGLHTLLQKRSRCPEKRAGQKASLGRLGAFPALQGDPGLAGAEFAGGRQRGCFPGAGPGGVQGEKRFAAAEVVGAALFFFFFSPGAERKPKGRQNPWIFLFVVVITRLFWSWLVKMKGRSKL